MKNEGKHVFEMTGGALCLDFANTAEHRPDVPIDHIRSYEDLVGWAVQAGLIGTSEANRLRGTARSATSARDEVFQRAVAMREAIYRIFSAIAKDQKATQSDLKIVEREALVALRHRRLECGSGRYEWCWRADDENSLDRILWPVSSSAVELLTSDELSSIRECAADTCDWLFLDNSRNQSRRWCDMKVCGNRAKASRHYRRIQQETDAMHTGSGSGFEDP